MTGRVLRLKHPVEVIENPDGTWTITPHPDGFEDGVEGSETIGNGLPFASGGCTGGVEFKKLILHPGGYVISADEVLKANREGVFDNVIASLPEGKSTENLCPNCGHDPQ